MIFALIAFSHVGRAGSVRLDSIGCALRAFRPFARDAGLRVLRGGERRRSEQIGDSQQRVNSHRQGGQELHFGFRDCQKFCVLSPVDLTIDLEPIAEHHGKLRLCRTPFASRHLPYMDAPLMPSAFFGPGSQE